LEFAAMLILGRQPLAFRYLPRRSEIARIVAGAMFEPVGFCAVVSDVRD